MVFETANVIMEKIKEYALMAAIIIFAVILYVLLPYIFYWMEETMRSGKALLLGGVVTLLGTGIFYLWGYRGKELLYIFVLIVFVMGMIWLYFNYHNLDVFISNTYGQLAATGIFLLIIFVIWLFMHFFL